MGADTLTLLVLVKSIQFFEYDVLCGFSIDILYQFEEVPFYSSFAKCFYYGRVLDFVQ